MDAEPYHPYSMHAQCLIATLETCECGAQQIAESESCRQEALGIVTSFVQFDEADDPERFGRIASRIVDFIAAFARDPNNQPFESYRRLNSGVAALLREELGLPEILYFE